jgi:phenylpropionate dioxygenase-like ring-hydroxylating dioxygenase large terminal subunit
MIRHLLDAIHYRCPATFEKEQTRLFGKLWMFVGFTSQVADRNQFITRTVASVPVLVQRTDTGLRAFVNECPHRLSAIQTQSTGRRPLVCPYHAWAFGAEGQLRGIPNAHLYGFSQQERERICLKKLSLQTVGPLIFVNMDADPIPMSEQFSSAFLADLSTAADHLDEDLIYSCHQVNYNWKLAMENVKDHNHVSFVHPKSFSPMVASLDHHVNEAKPIEATLDELTQPGRPHLRELSYGAIHPMTPGRSWFSKYCDTYSDDENYRNWFIYPNVNFCSIKGSQFLLQQYEPVTSTQTNLHVWIMTARRKYAAPDFTPLLATLIRAERSVIAEDTVILEKLQSNLGTHSGPFTHGDYETPLIKHHSWYLDSILEQEF